jgi:hypothetical protein
MTQPTLWARTSDPDTSHAAAEAVNVPRRCAEVLNAMRRIGAPATAWDVTSWLAERGVRTQQSSVVRRLADLEGFGKVARTEERRMGGFGRMLIVWSLP